MKKVFKIVAVFIVLSLAYLMLAPIPVEPKAWDAPVNPMYTGDYVKNQQLATLEFLDINGEKGPEDIVLDEAGNIYASVHDGKIIKLSPKSADVSSVDYSVSVLAETNGRPLGIVLGHNGELIVADAYKGLLSISPEGKVDVLTNKVNGEPILYANNVDVHSSGIIYFTDASTKFGAEAWGGSYPASLLDLMEHGGYGRILSYNPSTGETRIVAAGFNFANGLSLTHDESALLMCETGNYRVLRVSLDKQSENGMPDITELVSALPAFPDNITKGLDGKYWVGLVSPRNPMLDAISDKPFLRKMVQRLPAFIRPKATYYGHVIAFNDSGEILHNLQDPQGDYPTNTSVFETRDYLYVGSLLAEKLGRLAWGSEP